VKISGVEGHAVRRVLNGFLSKAFSQKSLNVTNCKGSNTRQKCSEESLISVISAVSLTHNLCVTELSTAIRMFFLSLKFTVNTTLGHALTLLQCHCTYVCICLHPVLACGKRRHSHYSRPSARIVGGYESAPGDWPFLAALLGGPEEVFYCAGVIISDQWVLTASHCVGK